MYKFRPSSALQNFLCHILAVKLAFKFVFGAYLEKYSSQTKNFSAEIFVVKIY